MSSRSASPAPILVAVLGIAIFASMDAVMKGLAIAMGAYNAMFWCSIAGLLLTAPLLAIRRTPWPGQMVLRLHLARGATGAISILLFYYGLARTPLAPGIALTFIAPLIALGLAALFLRERVSRRAISGSLVAFAGVLIILASQTHADASPDAMTGMAAILIAAVFYAINLVILRRQALAAGPLEVAFFLYLVATGVYGIAAPWAAYWPGWSYLPVIAMVAIFSAISMMLLAWAYARAEMQRLVPIEYSAFLWAALFGWLVFAEPLSLYTLGGALLIVAGCLWAVRTAPPADPAPLSH